ncbi:3-dehydroquinate synthase [Salibacterium aidingense]|uniref:3-dehydroquinate synthase n=1 Tax=Salibacterium aidingense TaxID=384933 RepID=UPI000429BE9E|nr:3-dehydroquinate synthase [Salibacterium aidingense]
MEQLHVETPSRSYPVYIGEGIRHQAVRLLEPVLKGKSRVLIFSDANVASLYGAEVKAALEAFHPVSFFSIEAGESSKSLEGYEKGLTACMEEHLDRQSVIIALGGGVIGDLAGFVAATYMRGIAFVQMPTTLLAQDSSVGGKTGINHPLGKNLIGAFYQPEAVIYDTETLVSLPDKEWRSGFAEMIKHAYIKDPEFLAWLKENVQSVDAMKKDTLRRFLKRSIAIKADIVKEDEKESGVRAFLNFGHTLGHALEKVSGYGDMTHGEAVAAGMIFSMKLSNYLQLSDWNIKEEASWLEKLGYDVEAPSAFSPAELMEAIKNDKKVQAGELAFVLVESPGRPFLQKVRESDVLDLLTEMKKGGVKYD